MEKEDRGRRPHTSGKWVSQFLHSFLLIFSLCTLYFYVCNPLAYVEKFSREGVCRYVLTKAPVYQSKAGFQKGLKDVTSSKFVASQIKI